MVKYRGIEITLRSQYDILAIPEFSATPTCRGAPQDSPPTDAKAEAHIDNHLVRDGAIDIFVPVYAQSQFFFYYAIDGPQPSALLYYFKLFVDEYEVTSWGVDKEHDFRGSVMFAVFDSDASKKGSKGAAAARPKGIMKRGFFFAADGSIDYDPLDVATSQATITVKVYRASSRRRTGRDLGLERFEETTLGQVRPGAGGVALRQAGYVPADKTHKYYQYALLDALDLPFAEFRYHYRKYEDLAAAGITGPEYRLNPFASCRQPDPPRTPPAQTTPFDEILRSCQDMAYGDGNASPSSSSSSIPVRLPTNENEKAAGTPVRSRFSEDFEKSLSRTPMQPFKFTHDNKSSFRLSAPPLINFTPPTPTNSAPRAPTNSPEPDASNHPSLRSHRDTRSLHTQTATKLRHCTTTSDNLHVPPEKYDVVSSSPLHDPFTSPTRSDPLNTRQRTPSTLRNLAPPPGLEGRARAWSRTASMDILTGMTSSGADRRRRFSGRASDAHVRRADDLAREEEKFKQRIAAKEGLIWALDSVMGRKKRASAVQRDDGSVHVYDRT